MPAVRETPAVSSSANSAKAVSGSSSASRTLRESDARATPHAESEETENRGTCAFRSFAMRIAAPVAQTASAVLSETSGTPDPRPPKDQSTGTRSEKWTIWMDMPNGLP